MVLRPVIPKVKWVGNRRCSSFANTLFTTLAAVLNISGITGPEKKLMADNTDNSPTSLPRQIEAIRKDTGAESIAVSYYDYQTETSATYQGDRWFHAASTMKVPVLVALLSAVEQGRFALSSNLHVRNRFFSVVDGSPYHLEFERDS